MRVPSRIRGLIFQCRWLLRAASLIVPNEKRAAWYERQYAKAFHWANFLHESGRLNAATRLELVKNVWRSFQDATWQRLDRNKVTKWMHDRPRTARFCLWALTTILLITLIGSGFAPTVRSSLSALPYTAPERLAHLSLNNHYIRIQSESFFAAVSNWARQTQTASVVGAYSWKSATVYASGDPIDVISARVSPEFFNVLGVGATLGRLFHPGDETQCAGCIVLSNPLWQYAFHHDPAIVGKQIVLQGNRWTVVGVLPKRFWFISPEISVWTVGPSEVNSFTTADRTGVVLRLRADTPMSRAREEFSKFLGPTSGVDVSSMKDSVQQGTSIYLLFTMLAFLGSLVLLAYRLVNSSGPKVNLSLRDNCRWWIFFAAKTVLLLAICFLASLEGTHRAFLLFTGSVSPFAGPVSTWLFLVTTVLALTWSLRDQCRRCRLCLKRLGHEIYVGAPASLFLDWWGTELVCSQGHGMLHVPEMHASWLEMEQWTPLDESWKSLFEQEKANVS